MVRKITAEQPPAEPDDDGDAPGDDDDEDDARPPPEYEMAYYSPSGFGEHFSFLAMRFDAAAGFKSAYGETFVGDVEPQPDGGGLQYDTSFMLPGWMTELWRSSEGRVWVSESFGRVFAFRNPKDAGPLVYQLDGSLFGIWGLDDHHILTWGDKNTAPIMYRWDGRQWASMQSPPFRVLAVHGTGPNDIWAAGYDGGLAHWDGGAWRAIQTRVDELLVSVFVAGPDEIYACGNRGTVFEGSASGLARIGRIPGAELGDVTGVAVWKDHLWVAANRLGTWRRKGKTSKFECVKDNVDAVAMDVRQDMILAGRRDLVHTRDGKVWTATGIDYILEIRGAKPLGDDYP